MAQFSIILMPVFLKSQIFISDSAPSNSLLAHSQNYERRKRTIFIFFFPIELRLREQHGLTQHGNWVHIQYSAAKCFRSLMFDVHNSCDVYATVFSFQKHSSSKEGKVRQLVHRILFIFLSQWTANNTYLSV